MGLLQGRVDAHCFIILDTFALPVEGTETRVNAQQQAYEYMTVYTDRSERMGIKEKVRKWCDLEEKLLEEITIDTFMAQKIIPERSYFH